MRLAIALFMTVHGIAHLVGFLAPWRLIAVQGAEYKTTVVNGRLDLGDAGIRVMGLFWLIAAVAFCVVGAGAVANREWWIPAAIGVSIASLALSLIALPESRIGVAVNLVILAALILGERFAWL
jgi:hypothetical protein